MSPLLETGGDWNLSPVLPWDFEKKFNFTVTGTLMREHDERASKFSNTNWLEGYNNRNGVQLSTTDINLERSFEGFAKGSRKLSHQLKLFCIVLKVGQLACSLQYYDVVQRGIYIKFRNLLWKRHRPEMSHAPICPRLKIAIENRVLDSVFEHAGSWELGAEDLLSQQDLRGITSTTVTNTNTVTNTSTTTNRATSCVHFCGTVESQHWRTG